jgi:Uma2 family endonuclease
MITRVTQEKGGTNSGITFEDYLALPETMQRYEIIDGEMIMSPAPTSKHQIVIGNIYTFLRTFVRRFKLGIVILSPVDIIIRHAPKLRTRQPDVIFVSRARRSIVQERIEGGPDLVIEVLSPGDTRREMEKKLTDYAGIGVRECWFASIEAETVEVLQLSAKGVKRVGLYGPGDLVRSPVLPGLALPVKKLFAE